MSPAEQLTCDPVTELKIPDWTGLQVSHAEVLTINASTTLTCWNSSLVTGISTGFSVKCLPGGRTTHYRTLQILDFEVADLTILEKQSMINGLNQKLFM